MPSIKEEYQLNKGKKAYLGDQKGFLRIVSSGMKKESMRLEGRSLLSELLESGDEAHWGMLKE